MLSCRKAETRTVGTLSRCKPKTGVERVNREGEKERVNPSPNEIENGTGWAGNVGCPRILLVTGDTGLTKSAWDWKLWNY